MSWLKSLFHPVTVDKAKRDWRLLILNGHSSHCTLRFLEWCQNNRILLAIIPPHSTHRLQPLDVSLFRPLATCYSQLLDKHIRLSYGLASLTKRDFFKIFYQAFDQAFTAPNIKSGWLKTGLEPFDPEQVLQMFKKEEDKGIRAQTPPSGHSSRCLDSPSAVRKIRRLINEQIAQRDAQSARTITKLGKSCLALSAELTLAREREQGYIKAISNEKRKRKRSKAFTEDIRAEQGSAALFFSPSKVIRARELVAAKEATKDELALDRLLEAQDRAELRAQRELEAQQKRADRAIRVAARKAKEALKKAQKEQQKMVKQAERQLILEAEGSDTRPRKKQKAQQEPPEPLTVVIEPEAPTAPEQSVSRSGRIVRPSFKLYKN